MYRYNFNTRSHSPTSFINGKDTNARRGSTFNKVGRIGWGLSEAHLWADTSIRVGKSAKNMTRSS